MPKETLNSLNKKIVNLKNIADSLILVIDPDFKNVSFLLRKYCIVKFNDIITRYNYLTKVGNNNHYGSLVNQISALEDIISDLKNLLEKSGPKKSITLDVAEEQKVKKLK